MLSRQPVQKRIAKDCATLASTFRALAGATDACDAYRVHANLMKAFPPALDALEMKKGIPREMIWLEDERRDIEETVASRLEDHLGRLCPGQDIQVFGETLPDEVRASLLLCGLEGGAHFTCEARFDRTTVELDDASCQYVVLDALDALIFDWIESGRTGRFHGGWQERRCQGYRVSVRAEKTFPELDAQADALLAAASEQEGT